MKDIKKVRVLVSELITKVFNKLDKTGANTKLHMDRISKMSDTEFSSWLTKFLADDGAYLALEVLPWQNEPSSQDIEDALKILGVPKEEYVYFPHEADSDGAPVRTKNKVPVGYIFVRRLQQILSKKNSYTADITKRNQITGQVTGDSKTARISDAESNALISMEANWALKEFLGARADNRNKKAGMYQLISRDGYFKLADLEGMDTVMDNVSLNTVDIFLTGAGLKTDLVEGSYILPSTKISKGKNII